MRPKRQFSGSDDNGDIGYSEKHDAYFNKQTWEWLEEKCDDPDCEFCVGRPDKATE